MCGRPLGTAPSVDTPCALRSKIELTAIAPTTATRPPGTTLIQRSKTISVAITAIDTHSVATEVCPISPSVSANFTIAPLAAFSDACGAGTPSMPSSWLIAIWMPTPVRKPTRTVREMKSARKPRRASRARRRNAATSSALRLASASHCDEYGWSPEMPSAAIPAYMIAAVAESPPTTRCRDEAKIANATIGSNIVYRPVITGVPEIFV